MAVVKKIIEKIVQVVTWILLVLLLIAIYGKVQMVLLKQNYTNFFGYTMFQIASGSMEPTLSIDDVVLVKINADFKVDDTISFLEGDTIITHRVIAINGDQITVKGDANNTIDTPIDRKIIIGKVIKVFPELRIWQKTLSNPLILGLFFLTLLSFDFAFSYKNRESISSKKPEVKNEKEKPKEIEVIENKEENSVEINSTEPLIEPLYSDSTEKEDLLKLTRKIDLDELNKALNEKQVEIISETMKEEECETDESEIKEVILTDTGMPADYTVRLDLKAIQKAISKKTK